MCSCIAQNDCFATSITSFYYVQCYLYKKRRLYVSLHTCIVGVCFTQLQISLLTNSKRCQQNKLTCFSVLYSVSVVRTLIFKNYLIQAYFNLFYVLIYFSSQISGQTVCMIVFRVKHIFVKNCLFFPSKLTEIENAQHIIHFDNDHLAIV